MSVSVSTELYGVRDALRELGEIDRKLKNAAIARIRAAGSDIVAVARTEYPTTNEVKSDLEGWSQGGRLGYDKPKVDAGVKIKVGGKTPRNANAYAIVTLVQDNAGGALYDIAGLRDGRKGKPSGPDRLNRKRQPKQSKAFIQALNNGFGNAQRGLWPKRREIAALAQGNLRKALDQVAESVNRKLVE